MAFPMFMHSYIIEITLPNSPSSPTKKYRLTDKGKDLLAKEGQEDMEWTYILMVVLVWPLKACKFITSHVMFLKTQRTKKVLSAKEQNTL